MAGILVPVIIHLWNQREGKTVKVGSIALLEESARQQARSLRLKDLLLLLLRCLLIVVLAFLLAAPVWQKQRSAATEKGWLLMEKSGVKEAYRQHSALVDSLLAAGYRFHYFADGFAAQDWAQALQDTPDTGRQHRASYWTLLKQLNEELPADLPVYLFTTNQLASFWGQRPALDLSLRWLTYATSDTVTKQPVNIFKASSGELKAVVANSTPGATVFTRQTAADGTVQPHLLADTAGLRIAVYSDGSQSGAAYLQAAVAAIEQVSGMAVSTTELRQPTDWPIEADWLFWLSERPLPPSLPPHVFYYQKGKEEMVRTFLAGQNGLLPEGERLGFSRRIVAGDAAAQVPVWTDAFGQPLLAATGANKNHYGFYSRLDPAWNDLPWNGRFGYLLYDLLFPARPVDGAAERRMIDDAQRQVRLLPAKDMNKQKFVERTDLTKLFWLVAFILFSVERIISLTPKYQLNG